MMIISKNNTFENTQTTSFLNKLDALIASGYADADDYSALIQCCLNVENAPENQRQVAADVVNVLRIFKIELLAKNSQKEFALQKFGKHLNNANLPIDIIKLLTVLFCKVFKTISADIAFKLLQEQFLNFNESDWQNFKTQYKDNAERNNFKDADFSADLHLIQNYFENFQNISANQFQQINAPAKQVANDAVTAFEAKRERNVVAITSEKDVADATAKEVAGTKISQATGTDGDLPTQKLASIINNAEADATATANNEMKFKNDYLKMIISQQTNNNNAENDTNVATDATNSASNIKTPPATKQAKNQSKAVTAKYHKKDYAGYIYSQDPVAEFESILTAYGLIVNKILIENKICRVGTSNNPKGDAGWLKYHTATFYTSKGEELIYLHGVYGNWASGEGTQFVNITNYDFENRNDSAEYLKEMQKIRKQAEKTRAEQVAELEKEIQAEYNKTAEKATFIYENLCDDYDCLYNQENPHDYLKNKNLFVDALAEVFTNIKVINSQKADTYFSYRIAGKGGKLADGEWLVIPIYNKAKNGVRTLQFIDITGNKTMLKGGEAGGGYFEIESNNKTDNYAIVEGVADALALSQVLTNFNVIVTFSAGNIIKVVGELVKANSKAKITIFADNDKESKTGEIQAKKAVEAHGGKYIMPPADYKDFCDFWTAEFAKNKNSNDTITAIQNYINKALQNKNVKKYRFIQKETKRVMSVDRAKTKNENEVGKIKATTQNVIEALQNREYCGFEFILEERSQNIEVIDYVEYSTDADGNEEMYFNEDGKPPRPLTELDYLEIKSRIEYHPKNNPTGFEEISINKILRGAVEFVARKKSYNKIQNFIDNLPKLNGVALEKAINKLENLFIYYANADIERFPSEYYKAVARCFMTEIIARCLTKTGCKADYVPILQGKQGTKKSQFCLSLINDPSLIADVDFDNNTDDIIRKISGKVIGVIDEMNGFGKKQASFVKRFITLTQDTYIPKYKEFEKVVTRSVVFIGTTNEEHFLNDDTGERRYYPIPIKDGAETRYLELQRDILEIYAAALHLYNEDKAVGIEITADGKEVEHNGVLFHNLESWNTQATKEFKLENPYITNIERWLNTTYKHTEYIQSPDYFVVGEKPYKFEYLLPVDIAMFALDVTKDKYNIHTHGKHIIAALKELGYKKSSKSKNGIKINNIYVNKHNRLNDYNNNNNDTNDIIDF